MSQLSSDTDRRATPVIRTQRLVLRAPEARDISEIVTQIGDPDVSRMLARVPYPYGRADAEAFIATAGDQNAAGDHIHLVIEHEGHLVGGIGLHGARQPYDFGYWLGRRWWRRGFATEAAAGLLGHAFEHLGVTHVPSGVFFDNPASLRVQEKLGFVRTGMRRVFSAARGIEVDHIDTLLTRRAFEEARS